MTPFDALRRSNQKMHVLKLEGLKNIFYKAMRRHDKIKAIWMSSSACTDIHNIISLLAADMSRKICCFL
jgi:hypothetical protein